MFRNFYSGRRVFVTGHTGFKGSWLSLWLCELGARVIGFAEDVPGQPCHFDACGLGSRLVDLRGDIRDFGRLQSVFREYQPEIVFHLAAQPLVRVAYQNPLHTFDVNILGTANVLEAARQSESVHQVVAVTSDKVYRNSESSQAFRETDELGGYEPYGASKACAELIVAAYQDPRFQQATETARPLAIASARAGNVIGGGDWGRFRLIPDIVRAMISNGELVIRFPNATRPWQHVLDSLSGYLWLGCQLADNAERFSAAWNFGPIDSAAWTVDQLARAFLKRWPAPESILRVEPSAMGEHRMLQVDSRKAVDELGWRPAWDIEQTLDATVDWYRTFSTIKGGSMADKSHSQIGDYCLAARNRGIAWA